MRVSRDVRWLTFIGKPWMFKRSFEQFEKKKLLDHQSLKRSFLYSKSSLPNGVLKYTKHFEKSSDLPQSRPKSYRSKETTNKNKRKKKNHQHHHPWQQQEQQEQQQEQQQQQRQEEGQEQEQVPTLLNFLASIQVTHREHLFTIHILCQMAMRSWQLGWQLKTNPFHQIALVRKTNITTTSPSLLLHLSQTKTHMIHVWYICLLLPWRINHM